MSCINNCDIKEQSLVLRDIVNCIIRKLHKKYEGFNTKNNLDSIDIQMLNFLSRGIERKVICKELNITEKTLRRRLNRVRKILGIPNDISAVAEAIRKGIIE